MSVWAILVAAGKGERLGLGIPKALVPFHRDDPLFLASLPALSAVADGLVVVAQDEHLATFKRWLPEAPIRREDGMCEIRYASGGSNRQASVTSGLQLIPEDAETIIVHDAARPWVSLDTLRQQISGLDVADAVIPGTPLADTVKRVAGGRVIGTVSRDDLVTVETPQVFRAEVLRAAHAIARTGGATDDATLVEASGGTVKVVWVTRGFKITTPADLAAAKDRLASVATAGIGFDAHELVSDRPLMLAGVHVPNDRGTDGHSDGDVVAHALCDAMLGAARLGDLGDHFPSSDQRWRDAAGESLMRETVHLVAERAGLRPAWADTTIILQAPAVTPHREAMRAAIARALGIDAGCVSVKATTTDRLGIIGDGRGVAAQASVGLVYRPVV